MNGACARLLCLVVAIPLVCLCGCASICAKCVIKVININKYKQNCDDVTCNMKIETGIDIHSDVKQTLN